MYIYNDYYYSVSSGIFKGGPSDEACSCTRSTLKEEKNHFFQQMSTGLTNHIE